MEFVPLSLELIPAILEIEKTSQGAPWSEKSFTNELKNPHSYFLVALERQNVIGYGGVWLIQDEAHVTTITVSQDHRRKGIGKQLMHELIKGSMERKANCMTLEVRVSNEPAIRLYDSLGFARAAVRKNYYPDNQEDAYIMWLYDLCEAKI